MSLFSPIRSSSIAKGSEFFEAADEDIAGDPQYFGFMNMDGCWIIQQRNAASGTYRYFQGRSDYSTNWTNRASLSYVTYNTLRAIL